MTITKGNQFLILKQSENVVFVWKLRGKKRKWKQTFMQSALQSLLSLQLPFCFKPTCLLPYRTSHLSWTQQRVNEIQKVLHGASYTTANITKEKERSQMNRKYAWMVSGRKQQAGLGWADGSTGCLQAGTAARWQWSSPPRRTGCTRKWAARQGLSSSTDASSHVATQDSLEDMASCIPSLPAPEPPCSPCLYKTCT